MLIIQANNIKHYYGERKLLDSKLLQIYRGDRIGLVGVNGSGKTTLMKILSGEIRPDEGSVVIESKPSVIRQFGREQEMAAREAARFGINKLSGEGISGGEGTRSRIAAALSENTGVLFADEPSSNLDAPGIELLCRELEQAETLLLISHDAALLDRFCTKIWEIKDARVNEYTGNFSDYQKQTGQARSRQQIQYEQYLRKKSQLEEAVDKRQQKAAGITKRPRQTGNSEWRLGKGKRASKTKVVERSAKVLKNRLAKLEKVEQPKDQPLVKIDFSLTDPPKNRIVVSADGLSFRYRDKVIFDNAAFSVRNGQKVALVGPNGSGKTTLLNRIFERDPAVRIAPKAVLGYFRQDFHDLDREKTILENLLEVSVQSESTARTILSRLLFDRQDIHKKVSVISGGELVKLSLARLLVSGANLLMLDEPTNYLDIYSIGAVKELVSDYEGTVLFVTHDASFVEEVADVRLRVGGGKILPLDGPEPEPPSETDRMLLELKITQMLSRLGEISDPSSKAGMEEELEKLLARRKVLENGLR